MSVGWGRCQGASDRDCFRWRLGHEPTSKPGAFGVKKTGVWLKMVIEAEGFEVRTALIGTRGEEVFKQWRPDVVVTDLMLPDIDGIALLRRLKEIDA